MIRTLKRLFSKLPIACHLEHSGEHCLLARCDACPVLLFDIQKSYKSRHNASQESLVQQYSCNGKPIEPTLAKDSDFHTDDNLKVKPRSRKSP